MTLRTVILSTLLALPATPALAGEFYAATAPRFFSPTDTSSIYYNPPGTRPRVMLDDVTVPFSAPSSRFQVTKVTVKISRATNAPAATITPYFSQLTPDSVYNGGANDFALFPDVSPPTAFGTPANLAAMGAAPFTETLLSFGNGTNTLFIVPGSTIGGIPGHHSFALGIQISDADSRNGWTIAQKTNNLDLLWDYVSSTNFSEFTYDTDSQGNFIIGTQYLRVEGQVYSGQDGDATADGRVDVRDLLALANHWLQPGDYSGGDFNLDGIVNKTDLGILALNWQAGVPLSDALPTAGLADAVPEPSSIAICLLSLPILPRRRHRRR